MTHIMTDIRTADKSARVAFPPRVETTGLPSSRLFSCGDSLISTIHGEQLIPDPTKTQQGMLAVTPIQIAIAPLLELEKRYFDAQTEERHQLREQILEAEANVFRVAVSDRHQYWLGKQKELETKIKTMKARVSKAQEKEKAEIATKLAELDKFAKEVESGERSLNFFQYHLHFRRSLA
jgi:hypothetical protein